MPPGSIPSPLPGWARWLLQAAPFISLALQEAVQYFGELHTASASSPSSWMHCTLESQFADNLDPADRWYTGFNVVNITGGAVDSTWTTTDHQQVSAALINYLDGVRALMPNTLHFTRERHYLRTFSDVPSSLPPGQRDQPFLPSGPPAFDIALSAFGQIASSGSMPPQNAMSVTLKTAYPKHWGRYYLPQLFAGNYLTHGQVQQTAVDPVANASKALYDALAANQFYLAVPVTQISKAPARALLGVTQIQVDNNPDVIRRRRQKTTTYRKVVTAG